jgi:hypothetical protein
MNLLKIDNDGHFKLEWFPKDKIPPYAILSHTWGRRKDDEITYKDIIDGTGNDKPGLQKLAFCGKKAKADDLGHFWIDTCCIDKSSSSELATAINSMFRYYHNSARCYAYLSDVSVRFADGQSDHVEWESAFRNSRWFERGWTLQELLAPRIVAFYSLEHVRLGDKVSLERQIVDITGISAEALRGQPLSDFGIEERFLWSKGRQTTEEEDMAYCMLGIFGVSLPPIYGEGHLNAMRRFNKEIRDSLNAGPQPAGKQPRLSARSVLRSVLRRFQATTSDAIREKPALHQPRRRALCAPRTTPSERIHVTNRDMRPRRCR